MLVVNARYPAFAAVLLGVSTVLAETPAPTAPSNSALEDARRDLRALPALERSQEVLGKSTGLGSAGLPMLTLPGAEARTQKKEDVNGAPSSTWLLDAVQKTEAEQSGRRAASAADAKLDRESASGRKATPAVDPFGQYLKQWLSPRDLELLRPEAKNGSGQKTGIAGSEPTPSLGGNGRRSEALSGADVGPTASIIPVTKNPYLADLAPPPPATLASPLAQPAAPVGLPLGDRNRSLSAFPASNSGSAPRPVVPAKPAVAPAEAFPHPPTAPLVDDRKYFPQLRRF